MMEQWILLLSVMVSKTKKLRKKEVMHIEKCLKELDLEVMEAFKLKLLNNIYLFIQQDKFSGTMWRLISG